MALALTAFLAARAMVFASPAQFAVDSTADAVDSSVGDGACRTVAGTCTLRAAIQEANALPGADEIQLPSGTYELGIPPRNQNDITTGDLDITGSLTIDGAGAGSTIVDGGAGASAQVPGMDRLFEVSVDGGAVAFSGLTITDGHADEYGGAIANNSTATVTITASTLTGNVAGKAGGALDNHVGGQVDIRNSTFSDNFARENGSAINNNRGGAMTITDSTVSSNSAADVGLDEGLAGAGAISNNAELDTVGMITVTDSDFVDNRAGGGRSGASISNDGAGAVTIEQATFSKNRAAANGGAIFNGSGQVTVADSTFTENAATDGGAIYSSADKGGFVNVTDSTFTLNHAVGGGGAVVGSGSGALEVLDSSFSKNSADDWGGAVLNQNQGSATIRNVTFTENAGLNGGGFANEGAGLVTVESSTFTKNIAEVTSLVASGEGGGMHSNSGGEVVVSGGTFTDNRALSGGGLSNEGGGSVTVTGTRFTGNYAQEHGGGVLIQSGAVRMVNIDVVGNTADSAEEGGGGISYAGDKAVGVGETAALELSRIRDNKAKGPGGGIDSRGDGPLAITTTSITGNTASSGGAVHHVGDAPLEITRSTLSGNLAEDGGGVFTDGDGEATVDNTTVSGNRAGQLGGGFLVSSRLNLRNSTVAANTAASGGGINNGGGPLVGDGLVFLRNTIVAGSPTGGNCVGTMTSLGGNLDSANTCQLRELTDQPGTDPRLGPLAANGGPTQTHALLAGSPAQEAAVCTELEPCPSVDQRGVERPRFDGFDVGAYESELTPSGGGEQRCAGLSERPVVADFDSWVSQSSASSNFGNDSILTVGSQAGGNERALVHFDLPPIPPGCKVISATLRLWSASATEGRTLEARRITSDWNELSVAWNNQPPTASPAATTQSGLGTREWDVLAQTLDMYAHGDHGFLIRDSAENGSGEQSFHSGEKGPEHPPELTLVFDDPDAPPLPGTCPTTPQLVSADRDSWVSESSATNNFGSDSTLKVRSQAGNNARALVRFPLPPLPSGCTGIASAKLRVEADSAKDGHTLEALQVAGSWSETGVTWANQPGVTGPAARIPSAQGPLEWEVTEQLLGMYTTANHGFLIRDAQENGVGDEQSLNSRDKATDNPPSLLLTFDDSTPETAIDTGPEAVTDRTEATFVFSSDRSDARFECSLDGAAFAPCSSPHTIGVTEGDHSFQVRATRRVRAVDPTPASYAWKVAIPPKTTILDGPASPSDSADAVVAFTADDPDATFECSLNGAAFEACSSPVEYTNLADGDAEVRVRGTDPLGNVEPTPARHAWTVAVPPDTTIDNGPPALGNSTSASFEFGGTDNGPDPSPLTFECRLDSGAWTACSSPQSYGGPGEAPLADGQHTFEVRATDRAGNRELEPASRTWTVDTVAPETTIGAGPPELDNTASASFEFDANEPAGLECRLDAGQWEACVSPREYGGLADGGHRFEVRATDRAGNLGGAVSYVWTIDTVAPETTIESAPSDPSNDPSPSFAFSADEQADFECRLDAGEWAVCGSPRDLTGLADGEHTFAVRGTDPAGNLGAAASYSWTVDTVAPETTITSAPSDPSNDSSPSFEFSADEAADFECRLDTGVWAGCASPRDLTALSDGAHTFAVRATDRAGNLGAAASHSWTVDTVAPETTIESAPSDPSNDSSPSFEFSADEQASFECRLDAGEWAGCASPRDYVGLADGAHTFAVRATDGAGNLGAAASYSWTVDTVAPGTTIESGPAALSRSAAASFGFSADEAAEFECRLDAGDWASCSSPRDYVGLAEGAHSFAVRATDRAGNLGAAASYSWTVDTVAPKTTITAAPADPSNDSSPRFEFSADEQASFECQLDAGAWAACVSPHDLTALSDGAHTFAVRATDRAGNLGAAASHSWTVDTVAPQTTIESGPAQLSRSAAASFEFSANESAEFQCRLDAAWAACTSPQDYIGLAEGGHSFAVRATDRAGNLGAAASYAWTVDTVAPTTTITSAPADPSNDSSPSVEFSADEQASFECKLDAGEWGGCASPRDLIGLADGAHTFAVRATDGAGNLGTAASYSWTVDTVAPTTTIESAPAALSRSAAASFEFSADEAASFDCKLDAGEWAACTSPKAYAGLSEGGHSFAVRATDPAGNVGAAASYSWTVDTVAPQATITAAPADPSNDTSPSFEFAAGEAASFECRLDAGAWVGCASPRGYTGLADGNHTFHVRATDPAGNLGAAASYSWTVDTVAPTTMIESAPAQLSRSAAASFELSADEAAEFECSLDAGAWEACSSPQDYVGLAEGEHSFAVRATDRAGNLGAAASYSWTVDTVAPETAIESAPSDPSNDSSPSFEFAAGEAASFECKLDAGAWVSCTSPHGYTGLADGNHTFQVRATDGAGNLGAAASHTWRVDTVAPSTVITAAPSNPSDSRAASFAFSAGEAASFECKLDAGAWLSCTSPQGYSGLADGEHTFQVRATDTAGNQGSAASYTWTIDTTAPDSTAPDTTITATPAALSNSTSASFSFTGSDNDTPQLALVFQCRLDSQAPAAFASCTSPRTYTGLSQGSHTFEVRASDAAGNTDATPASYTWTVDTVAPSTTITSGPSGLTNDSTPTFGFSSEAGASFQCRVDAGAFAACSSPHTTAALSDGGHTFEVRATDAAGNTGAAATRAFTVDTTAPQSTITSGPSGLTNDSTPTFGFSSEAGASFQCRVDVAAFAACSSPHTTATLSNGAHTFEVRAIDAAGNTGAAASRAITVDTTGPTTTITSGPSGPTNDSTPTFGFSSEAGASFQCRVDTAAFAACSSPHTTAVLAAGAHTFEVRASDPAGNLGAAASRAITVDTAAPQTTITNPPPTTTTSTSVTFTFSSSETGSSFECSLDGAAFASCTSPRAYTGLAVGAHTFSVRARDAAGNLDATPANHSWTITAPQQGCGSPVTALTAADAWIDENSPTSNKGTDSILKVQTKGPRDNFRALVRFTLPAVPQGCVVESATLRLFAASAKTPRTLQALRLTSAWTENLVNWSNQPQTTGAAATTAAGTGYREWTVTSQAQAMYLEGNHGFLIRDAVEGQDAEQQFHSREKGQNPPQLVVRFAPAGG